MKPVLWPLPRSQELEQLWQMGAVVPLAAAAAPEQAALAAALGPSPARTLEALAQTWGPGVLVGSGGSSGGRRWCLQPLSNLQASADATAAWLQQLGLEPQSCLHLNPLPLQHVSGLMPLVRSRQWRCGHQRLQPLLMRDPLALAAAVPLPADRAVLLSLVPTQLQRLMAAQEGLAWLQQLALIWVGGAPLPALLAAQARAEGLRLSPCYGATETAAMVCALPPERFLAGDGGCGRPLADVELRVEEPHAAIAVRSGRLSPGWLENGVLQPLPQREGWWRSGDAGALGPAGLTVLGRLDGAIHSGGETVFPELLEERLLAAAAAAGLPLQAVLLLAEPHPEWGERLVALVRGSQPEGGVVDSPERFLAALAALTAHWLPAERPSRWLLCAELALTPEGKWQRGEWQRWLQAQAGSPNVGFRAAERPSPGWKPPASG